MPQTKVLSHYLLGLLLVTKPSLPNLQVYYVSGTVLSTLYELSSFNPQKNTPRNVITIPLLQKTKQEYLYSSRNLCNITSKFQNQDSTQDYLIPMPILNQYYVMPSHLSHVNPNNLKIKVRVPCSLSLDTFERYFQFFGLLTHWKSNSHRIPLTLSINRDYYKTEITYFIQQIFKEPSLPGTSIDIRYTIVKWKYWQRRNIRAEGQEH